MRAYALAMPLKVVTFRSPEEKVLAVDSLAQLQQRDRSFVINDALDQYLSLHDYHRQLIEEGIRQADAGQLSEHAEVVESVRKSAKEKRRA